MIDIGSTVRTLLELVTDGGDVIPANRSAMVVGYQGDRLIIATDDAVTVVCDRWEVRREPVRRMT